MVRTIFSQYSNVWRWSDAHVGTVLLRSGDGYRREEPELESEKFVALQVDFLYIPRLGDVRRDG